MGNIVTKLTFSLFKKLACGRLKEAKILFKKKNYSGAYYLSGYVIEMGLKAYYCKGVKKHTFPPEKKIVDSLYSHKLEDLLNACELNWHLDTDIKMNNSLKKAWGTVKEWNEKSRYQLFDKNKSESMINSVEEVFKWIQTKWS